MCCSARLRGKARDWNWHNVIGFWSSTVLVVLTLTAAVMSYPWANDLLYTLTGSEPPRRAEGPGGPSLLKERGRAVNAAKRARPPASFDILLTRAQEQVPGWVMIMLRFQPRGDGPVTASIQGPDAFHPFQRSQLTLNRTTGDVVKWEPYANNSTGRKLRTWVRALHTGEAFGFPGQTVAGLASLGGCFLVWTGLAMAWRRFRSWRRTPKEFTAEESVMNTNTDQINFPNPHQPEIESVDAGLAHSLSEVQTSAPNGANGHARAVQDLARERATAPFNGESVLILYGTVTGNSETLAKKLADTLRPTGLTARARHGALPTERAQASELRAGRGEHLRRRRTARRRRAVLGSDRARQWSGFGRRKIFRACSRQHDLRSLLKCGRDFDAALERHGAIRIYPRVDCDVDFDDPADAG